MSIQPNPHAPVKLSLAKHKHLPDAQRPLFIFRQPTRGDGLMQILSRAKEIMESDDVDQQVDSADKTFEMLAERLPRMLFGWRNQQIGHPCEACFGERPDCPTCKGDGAVYEDLAFDPQHPEKLLELLGDQDLFDLGMQLIEQGSMTVAEKKPSALPSSSKPARRARRARRGA